MKNTLNKTKYTLLTGLIVLGSFAFIKPASAFYIFPEQSFNFSKFISTISKPVNVPQPTPQAIQPIMQPQITTEVKLANDDTIYHLDWRRNLKKPYINKTAYLAYGNILEEIKQTTQSELNKWTELKIVSSVSTQDIYYLGNKKKAKIKPEHFNFLNIDPTKVINIHPVDLAQYPLSSYTAVGLSVPAVAQPNNLISIKIAPESPQSGLLANNTKDNLLSVFTVSSPNEKAEISSITFNLGIFNTSVIDKLYLTDEGGVKLKIPSSRNNQKVTFNFRDPLIIKKGQTKKLKLFINLASCTSCANDTIQATISDASDIQATINLAGNFPIRAAAFKLIDTNSTLANITIEEKDTNLSSAIIIGTTDQILAKFQINEISGNEDVIIKQITLVAEGTIHQEDLDNFKIKIDGKIIALAKGMIKRNKIIFNIPGFILNKHESKELIITSNIVDGEAETVNINFESANIIGKNTNFSLSTNLTKTIEDELTIAKESLSIFAKDLQNNQRVFSEQQGVIMGSFQIRNINQITNLESIDIRLDKNTAAPNLESLIYLVDYTTGEVFSSANGAELAQGKINMGLNYYRLRSKQEITISLITNIPRYAKDGDNYQINLDKVYYEAENDQYYEENTNIPGKLLVVNRSNLYIHDSGENDFDYIKGQKNVKIASFFVEVSAIEDIVLNSITLARGNTSGNITYDNGFSNMRVTINASRRNGANCGIIQKPGGGSFGFDACNIRLVNGNRYEIHVYVDTEENLKVSQTQIMLADLFASGVTSGFPTVVEGKNIKSYTTNFGDIAMDVQILNGGQVIRSEQNNLVGSFTIDNTGDEDINISNMNITTSNIGFSYGLGYTNLKIVNRNNSIPITIQNIGTPVGGSNKFNFNNIVSAHSKATFDIYVDASENVPVGNFRLYLSRFTAYGKNSRINATITGDPTGYADVNVN